MTLHPSGGIREAPVPTPRRKKLIIALVIVLIVLILAVLVVWRLSAAKHLSSGGFGGRGGRFSGASFGPMPVGVASIGTADVPVIYQALGTVTPLATVAVRSQLNGQLTQVAFHEGQMVKAGDFLAQVDPRPYQAALGQAEGALARDQALLKEAEIDLARYQGLAAQNSIATQQVDNQQSLVHQYEGTVKADQAQVDMQQLNLTYAHITAPVSGRVGLRQVDVGNYVTTGDANGVAVITELEPISVLFAVPEDDLQKILARMHSGASLPAAAFDRSQTVQLALGKLSAVDNQVDVATGTVKLRALFDNRDHALFPNQFVNVSLTADVLKGALVMPVPAIQRGAQGSFVYKVNGDSTVSVQTVTLGPQDGQRVVVQSGLKAGDRVVTDGADRLKDGAQVEMPSARTAVAPAAATGHAKWQHKPGETGHHHTPPGGA
ncbi:MAG TPA: MdtA/MuxA family multidrug efflux RND transporter periplasmic adaptor subunit [Gammaproteobacteria bacterium]|jgi:multidrug efflux system membrane fusion protein